MDARSASVEVAASPSVADALNGNESAKDAASSQNGRAARKAGKPVGAER